MSSPAIQSAPPAGWRARWKSQYTAWLLFAPPAVLVGLRAVLDWLNDRQGAAPALTLLPLSTPEGPLDLLWPVATALVVLTACVLVIRRMGWQRVMPVAAGLWLLLWLGGSVALLYRHLNEQGLFLHEVAAQGAAPNPGFVAAQVLASQFKPPSLRGVGGTELVLQAPGLDAPHRLLMDDPQARQIRPGATLALQFSPGRFSGLFVTDWRVVPANLPAPSAAAPP